MSWAAFARCVLTEASHSIALQDARARFGVGCHGGTTGSEKLSLLYWAPAAFGIELTDCGCCFRCGLPQIFLEEHTILIDDE